MGETLISRGQFDFAVDLPFGQAGEVLTRSLLQGVVDPAHGKLSVEVKRDSRALETGRVYLEYEQQPKGSGPWIRSGLATTEAAYFAVVIGNSVLFAPVPAWKYVGNQFGTAAETGGDNPTRGRTVPLDRLVTRLAEAPFLTEARPS